MSNSVFEEDVVVEGNITSKEGSVEVKGQITGDVSARSVTVHQTGTVDGAVKADMVAIQGRQSGSIACDELTLDATADVKSDVNAKAMMSHKGAKVVGKMQITGA